MKITNSLLIVIVLIIINLFIGGILLYTISTIEAPELIANIDILDINEDEIIIQIGIEIYNPNFFSIIVEDLNIKCMNESRFLFGKINNIGGIIEPFSNNSFISNNSFSFIDNDLESIINDISVNFGFNFLGIINRVIPLKITLITHLEEVLLDIKPPEIILNAEISKVTEEGIRIIGDINVYNPNNFKIYLDNISLTVESDLKENVGNFQIISDEINPISYNNFTIDGDLLYTTINAETVFIKFTANAGAQIAGYEKFIDISSTTQFHIPDVKELLQINRTMNFSISTEFKLQIDGILSTVGLVVYNPSEIPLQATNLVCIISLVTNNETIIIAENDMESSSIPSKNEVMLKTNIKIPYYRFLIFENGKIFPDWLFITIKGDFSIEETNKSIPLTFNGFIDLNLLE